MFKFKRTDESKLTNWWFGTDKRLLMCVLSLVAIGLLAMFSVGSVSADRGNFEWSHYLMRALQYVPLGLIGLFCLSCFANKQWVLRIAFVMLGFSVFLFLMTFISPVVINGSRRWVEIAGFRLAPSAVLKPAFIILTALFLTKMKEKFGENIFVKKAWDIKKLKTYELNWWMYFIPLGFIFMFIFYTKDFGSLALYFSVFTGMLLMVGLSWRYVFMLFGGLFVLIGLGAAVFPYARARLLGFLGLEGGGDSYQIDSAIASIKHGGLFGQWNDAYLKERIPDSHTDFVYSGLIEDAGAILCIGLLALIYKMIQYLIENAQSARDKFVVYATGGCAILFTGQVAIHVGVNLAVLPNKGMTLPFVSSGMTSFFVYCILFGMILAILREDKWK